MKEHLTSLPDRAHCWLHWIASINAVVDLTQRMEKDLEGLQKRLAEAAADLGETTARFMVNIENSDPVEAVAGGETGK